MYSIKNILFRIIPIITLVAFISLGVINIFQREDLTYINVEYRDKETNEIYNNPTEEQKQNSYKSYTYDLQSYANNIDQDILTRSINNTIDLQAYTDGLTRYKTLWHNGYQFGDVSLTIVNSFVLLINSIILPINILITPLRLTAGIFLTAMSIVGINTEADTFINNLFNGILDYAAIPLINPNWEAANDPYNIMGKTYKWNNGRLTKGSHGGNSVTVTLNFENANGKKYTRIIFYFENDYISAIHAVNNNIDEVIYTDSYGWIRPADQTIIITYDNDFTDQPSISSLKLLLSLNATEQ